jgi:hypothetical protein
VEGLDVDNDSFDKFGVRHQLAQLLLVLWNHPMGEFKKSIAANMTTDFASAIIDDLVYVLPEATLRLKDVQRLRVQVAAAAAATAAVYVSAREQQEQQQQLKHHENSAKSNVTMSNRTMLLLSTLLSR